MKNGDKNQELGLEFLGTKEGGGGLVEMPFLAA